MLKYLGTLIVSGLSWTALAATAPQYQSAASYFAVQKTAGLVAGPDMGTASQALAQQFDAICGDTFCAGDYSNLTSLGVDCSVSATVNKVGACQWSFAGSYSEVDAATGALVPHNQVFHCDLGVSGTPSALASFLETAQQPGSSGYDGLTTAKIPGTDVTLYDQLTRCL